MRANSKLFVSALIAATFSAGVAQASGFRDTAMVVSSTPVYESVNTPQRDCWTEQTGYEDVRGVRRERSYGGALLGGIVGGLLGNTIGKGSGRSVATAVGAATGAIAGDNIDNDGHEYQSQGPARPRYEQRCRTVDNWTRQLTGYNVVYRYQGHEYTTFMTQDPGRSVKVNVDVSLAERY